MQGLSCFWVELIIIPITTVIVLLDTVAEHKSDALVKWAETATFPEQVMLSDAENIFDVKRYVRFIYLVRLVK